MTLYTVIGLLLILAGLALCGWWWFWGWLERNDDAAFGEGPDEYADAWVDEPAWDPTDV